MLKLTNMFNFDMVINPVHVAADMVAWIKIVRQQGGIPFYCYNEGQNRTLIICIDIVGVALRLLF